MSHPLSEGRLYEAGPYSEGIYQIDLPVDAAILATVKPVWRGSFSAG